MAVKQFWRMAFFILAVALGVAACGSDSETADAEVADETTTTTAPETTTTAAPETTTTVPETTTAAPAPDVVNAPANGLSDFGTAVLGASELAEITTDEAACIGDGLEGLDTSPGFDALPVEDQVTSIEVGIDCAPETLRPIFISSLTSAAAGVDAGVLDVVGGRVGDCLFDGLVVDDADQPNRIAALVYSGAGQPSPDEAIDPGANLLADCIDFDTLSGVIAGDGAVLQGGIDQTCVDETFDRDTAVAFYGGLLADPASTDGSAVPDSLLDVFACFDFGQLLADQFGAADAISEEEVACVNDAFRSPELLRGLVAGGGDISPDALTGLFECLSPETLGGILGAG